MATDTSADTPSTALVATLRSADGRFRLDFVLRPLFEAKHQDWHSYELHMISVPENRTKSLVSKGDRTLFLDKAVEPEVPMLCDGLRRVLATGQQLRFEPVDERDFLLEASPCSEGARVRVQYEWEPASAEFGWPTGVVVSSEDLLAFASRLEAAFNQLSGQ